MNYYVLNIDNILRKEVMEQWSKCTALNGSYQLLITVTCTKTDGQNHLPLSRWGMVCKYCGVGESHRKFYDDINYPCPYNRWTLPVGLNQCSSLNIPNELRISQHQIMVLQQTSIQSLSEKMMVLFTAERIGWLVPIGWGHCVQCFGCWSKIIYSKILFFVQRLQQFYGSIFV